MDRKIEVATREPYASGSVAEAVDLFAGVGWGEALKELGIEALGVEIDPDVCAVREARGHRTLQADVLDVVPHGIAFVGLDLLIASPPCQAWSAAGSRAGFDDLDRVYSLSTLLAGGAPRTPIGEWVDPRSELIVEPLRWAIALEPKKIALEQVPPVLDYWRFVAEILKTLGYSVWTGILSAERYGVPQTRRRAILMADRTGPVQPPAPTHQAYALGEPARHEVTLEGDLLPWVSMADALGWTGRVGFPRLADELAATEDGYRERDFRDASEPAFALTEKARSWTLTRPATTIAADTRVHPPGHKRNADDEAAGRDYDGRAGENAIRLDEDEAAILQGFPRGYPWHGSRTAKFCQIGNAVPPPLAKAILEALL